MGRVVLLAAIGTWLAGCTWLGEPTDMSRNRCPADEADECLSWAGFTSTDGLVVTASRAESGLDSMYEFELRGSPAAIDRALVAAEVAALERGISWETPEATVGAPLDQLRAPHSLADRVEGPDGRTINRRVVRGSLPEDGGDDRVHVFAFTT